MSLHSFAHDERAVNIEIGNILNLIILLLIVGGITGGFYSYVDASAQHSISVAFADLGSEIARDITNMYLVSEQPNNENINFSTKRQIPLTIGGKFYKIELINSTPDGMASVDISGGGAWGYRTSTVLNSVDKPIVWVPKADYGVYSSSGEITIKLEKIGGVKRLWIE